jgi:hypothetical protein
MSSAAASPFKGSVGLGYKSSWGRNVSKTFSKSAKQITSLWFTQFLQYARRIHHDSVQDCHAFRSVFSADAGARGARQDFEQAMMPYECREESAPPNMGLQVWLMTSKHTEPALHGSRIESGELNYLRSNSVPAM